MRPYLISFEHQVAFSKDFLTTHVPVSGVGEKVRYVTIKFNLTSGTGDAFLGGWSGLRHIYLLLAKASACKHDHCQESDHFECY